MTALSSTGQVDLSRWERRRQRHSFNVYDHALTWRLFFPPIQYRAGVGGGCKVSRAWGGGWRVFCVWLLFWVVMKGKRFVASRGVLAEVVLSCCSAEFFCGQRVS